ncbi:MAG: class I SAM-dependent methyltransferase [Oligoflexales bacterium]|nr:class I SAM-dependent methyltransferase [Oligoflexales bacterium]
MQKINFIFITWLFVVASPLFAVELFDVLTALKDPQSSSLSMPTPEVDGRMQTLNKKGAASPKIDQLTQEFLKHLKGKKALEIGAAYGQVVMEALKSGATDYIANDLDRRHLLLAAKNVHATLPKLEKKVRFCAGEFPIACRFDDNSFDSVLAARVLHFMNPEQLVKTTEEFKRILKPKGRVYIIAITPYVNRYVSFIEEYEKRKKSGDPFPGYVKSLRPYANPEVTNAKELANLHDSEFMFLSSTVLSEIFSQRGFKIIESKEIALGYESKIWQKDGRENVVFIAEKI